MELIVDQSLTVTVWNITFMMELRMQIVKFVHISAWIAAQQQPIVWTVLGISETQAQYLFVSVWKDITIFHSNPIAHNVIIVVDHV